MRKSIWNIYSLGYRILNLKSLFLFNARSPVNDLMWEGELKVCKDTDFEKSSLGKNGALQNQQTKKKKDMSSTITTALESLLRTSYHSGLQ